MAKKIAVVVTDRQDEALRMSIGLTLLDDQIDVYVLGGDLAPREALHLETIRELEVPVYSSIKNDAAADYLPMDQIAERLLTYDHVLPY